MSNITGNGKNRQGYRELQIMNAKIALMIEQIFMDFLYDSFYLRRSSSQVYKCPMFFFFSINEWTFWSAVQTLVSQ